jgi:hypothetical protein
MQPGLRSGWGRLYFVYGSKLLMNVPGSPAVLKSSRLEFMLLAT